MQADPVIDSIDAAVGAPQDMAALAIGVVDQGVEYRHAAQQGVIGVHQHNLRAVGVQRPQNGQVAGGDRFRQADIDQIQGALGQFRLMNPLLHHADPGRAVTKYRVGHHVPTQLGRYQVGRYLAAGQGAVREIP
ncbi:Uncharacterised protein [Mycobacteroides abscessus subsp. abscessus]|nr:Uncharacterised protein [Mycobacteroides abscessus subsp. abscessus]